MRDDLQGGLQLKSEARFALLLSPNYADALELLGQLLATRNAFA